MPQQPKPDQIADKRYTDGLVGLHGNAGWRPVNMGRCCEIREADEYYAAHPDLVEDSLGDCRTGYLAHSERYIAEAPRGASKYRQSIAADQASPGAIAGLKESGRYSGGGQGDPAPLRAVQTFVRQDTQPECRKNWRGV